MKKFPFINEEAEGCRPFNKGFEIHLMANRINDVIELDSAIKYKANFCITPEVTGNADQCWELSTIKTQENCPHDVHNIA